MRIHRILFLSFALLVPLAGCTTTKNHGRDSGVVMDAGTDAGDPCRGAGACWQCTPTTDENFLNRCTSAACAPFDNAARIPGYVP